MTPLYGKYIGVKSIFYFCSLPLRLDAYKGCLHACLYCFSQTLNNRSRDFFSSVTPSDPNRFSRLMKGAMTSERDGGLVTSFLRRRVPVHLGCLSDPFQPAEATHHVTRDILRTLIHHQYPAVVSTKSVMPCDPEYLSLLRDFPVTVQLSFSTLDDTLASRLEPNAPPPSRRLLALERISAAGIRTVARLQPFLYPFEQLEDDTFRALSNAGARHVLLEHLRIPTNSPLASRKRLSKAIGADVLAKYRTIGMRHSRVNYELASQVKLPNVLLARRLAHVHGMTFGAGDNEFHHFSDELCCCGTPPTLEFAGLYSGHLGRGLFDGLRSGIIDFSYLDHEWHPEGSIREFINSDCRLKGLSSIPDLLRDRIRKPHSSNSPASFYGVACLNGAYRMTPEAMALFADGGSSYAKICD